MYVINGIPEFRKMGTGIPIFDLNGFRVFRFDFPPESSGIPNSEAEFRIPVVPGNGISKRNSQPSWSTNKDAMWVHQAFLLQFIVQEIDVLLQDNITKNDKLKKFLGLPSSDDCGGRLNLVVWNGQILYTKP